MRQPQDSSPQDAPAALWASQQALLALAERLLGPRDRSKQIYQPVFNADGPFLRNTPNLDGAFVELSPNAAGYWPTAIYEMAHETVHLLNPVAGGTNFLEEGIAVAFAMRALEACGLPPFETGVTSYTEALNLVGALAPDIFAAGRRIREYAGALGKATRCDLEILFPAVDRAILCRLSQPFPLRGITGGAAGPPCAPARHPFGDN